MKKSIIALTMLTSFSVAAENNWKYDYNGEQYSFETIQTLDEHIALVCADSALSEYAGFYFTVPETNESKQYKEDFYDAKLAVLYFELDGKSYQVYGNITESYFFVSHNLEPRNVYAFINGFKKGNNIRYSVIVGTEDGTKASTSEITHSLSGFTKAYNQMSQCNFHVEI